MATIYRTDGSTETVTPKNGKDFKLDEIRALIGCEWIEVVYPQWDKAHILIVDEEGKLKGKAFNEKATAAYGNAYDHIVGDALYCKKSELK